MNALTPGYRTFEHEPCRYGGARIPFRGPHKRLKGSYVTFLGGTETFGPYVATPFPELIELQTGLTCVNLGCRKGGIDAYLSNPSLIDLCSMGEVTVIEVTGAQNMSNRFYSVDPRRNNRFLRASKIMKSIFFEFDFANLETTEQMLSLIACDAADRMPLLKQEIQTAWVARMRSLVRAIDGPVILLWAADHPPFSAAAGGSIARPPQFVDRAMLDAVLDDADHLVEVVIGANEVAAGYEKTLLSPKDIVAAAATLGPVAHRRIATAVTPVLSAMLGQDDCAAEQMAISANIFRHSA